MIKQYNYVLLLAGLLFMLIGGSVGTENPHVSTRIVVDVTLLGVFLFGVWSLVESRIAFMVGWCLGGLAAVLIIGAYATDRVMLQYLALVAVLMFLFITCLIAVYDVLFGGTIDINRLVGAGCIYLMSGTIWGIVYFLLNLISPGSFEGIAAESWGAQLNAFVYHSFVTLTTLGYGDVRPVLPVARAICYLEAVLGQLYLTVLVAALVGMHIAGRRLVIDRNQGEPSS
jgi:voltage-gated potassium channel